jgi:peptidoglycan/LPS O-acetylase OafA/YrhL
MVSHTAEVYDPKDPLFNPYWAMLANGQIGVAIFFVISGFLITNLLLKELDGTGGISLRRFYVRRAFRILPAYYVFLLAMLATSQLHWIFVSGKELVSSFVFLWNYIPSAKSWWLGHTWSLCVEEQFYFLWPVALVRLGRERAWRLAIWIIALSPVLRVAIYFMLPAFRNKLTFFLSTRADALMIGCVLALCASEPWFLRLWNSVGSARVAWACAAFIFIGSPVLFSHFHFAYQMTLGYSLEVLCIGVILYWCVNNPKRGFARLLNLGPVAFIGVLSYSIYLWQQPFMRFQGSWSTSFPYNIFLILTLATISYYFVERPALEAREWFSGVRQSNAMRFLLPEDVTK